MTQPTSMLPEDQNLSDFSDSPGRRLRALRQSRGMEIERVAAQLHLERGIVESLERDQFEALPSPVFIAGYLRNYARLLGADPAPIVDAYRSMRTDHDATAPLIHPAHRPTRKPGARSGLPWAWIAAVVLVFAAVGLAGLWWQGHLTPDSGLTALEPGEAKGLALGSDQSQADQSEQTASNEDADAPAADQPDEPAPIDSFGSTASVPPDAIPLRSLTPAATSSTAADQPSDDAAGSIPASGLPTATPSTPNASTEPKKQEVALQFTGTSWVDVRDSAGQVVLNGEMRDGDRRVLTGEPPYKLVIGNAAATQLMVGDKPFDLDKRAQGNVARFTLDPNQADD